MKSLYGSLACVILVVSSSIVSSQQKPEPANKLVEFHMALLKHGPKWTATESEETKRLHQDHVNYVLSTLDSGKAIIAGPLTDGGDIDGIYVFRAKSAEEAKAWAEADPSVASGLRKCIRGGPKTFLENRRNH